MLVGEEQPGPGRVPLDAPGLVEVAEPDEHLGQVALRLGDRVRIAAVLGQSDRGDPAAYERAGATWWLENIHDTRGSIDEVLALVTAGPST